ncbi:hypothetical protein AVEN_97219-1 [Araneus ventricosus]|uniref:Uncharacterized protein n=1 Tax=Araneus ventricosus TaxID=182803 RepID=A0A4Y2GB32_ARAVE|nr:hypothetical protein AVEN_97219-1 [Araneus ventricosus]
MSERISRSRTRSFGGNRASSRGRSRKRFDPNASSPTGGGHREYTDQLLPVSKQEHASPGDIVMAWLQVPPPVIVRTSFGRCRVVAR